jgi:phosphoglucosamine mutase
MKQMKIIENKGIQRQYFGTDGIRSKVGSPTMNPEFMLRLAFAIGKVLLPHNNQKVLIARDTRLSGHMLESALQSGLNAAGINARLLGVIPTPALAYLTRSLNAAAGIVISASHNSFEDNGIKLFNAQGLKLSDEMEIKIEQALCDNFHFADTQHLGESKAIIDAIPRYIEFSKNTFPYNLSLQGIKIVIDCANGAGFYAAPSVLRELGATVIPVFDTPNGININDSCGATYPNAIQKAVRKYQADVGIALDGDGDRLILADHTGNILDGDDILAILAEDYTMRLPHRQFGIVGTVMSNLGLEEFLTHKNIGFCRTQVGDRYVLKTLLEKKWPFGGEKSGHIICFEHTPTGDALIASLQVLSAALYANKALFDLSVALKKYPQVMINVPVSDKNGLENNTSLKQLVKGIHRTLSDHGRLVIRPSGTEPLIRVMLEGKNIVQLEHLANQIADCIQSCGADTR